MLIMITAVNCDKNEIAQHCWEADHNFTCD